MVSEAEHAELEVASGTVSAGDGPLEQPRHGKRGAPQAFARKLAEILGTESTDCISWNAQGTAFQVHDVERFSEDILTKYYRHSKFSSFQRQLNLYSFRKIVKGPDAGGYAHPMFRRDRPDDLYHVRRSISGSGRYESPAAVAKAAAKRNAASAVGAKQGNGSNGGAECAAPRAHKSAAAARRVGKLRNKASTGSSKSNNIKTAAPSAAVSASLADHQRKRQAAPFGSTQGAPGGGVFFLPTDIDSDAGEKSPWTSGDSGGEESDANIVALESHSMSVRVGTIPSMTAAGAAGAAAKKKQSDAAASMQKNKIRAYNAAAATSRDVPNDQEGETESSSSLDSDDDGVGSDCCAGEEQRRSGGDDAIGSRRHCEPHDSNAGSSRDEQLYSYEVVADERPDGECAGLLPHRERHDRTGRGQGGEAGANSSGQGDVNATPCSSSKKSPFNFFKKTFSFMDRSSGHGRGMSTSSVDMLSGAAGSAAASSERPSSISDNNSSSSSNNSSMSSLMVDTSATARAAAAGVGVVDGSSRGVRPPPVTVTGGGHRIPIDPSNRVLLSSPLTPKSSMEAAAMAAAAAAAAAAMPPPPKREQREELGLVEQLTNMVEVFDICDLLRKVSTSNSSRLDKHGGIVKPAGAHHTRNMSVDTDQGLPQSPLHGKDGQSPTGLGSLESMELVRESSKDWDTLMAGSADVSDLGSTMVQSVAEFFSF